MEKWSAIRGHVGDIIVPELILWMSDRCRFTRMCSAVLVSPTYCIPQFRHERGFSSYSRDQLLVELPLQKLSELRSIEKLVP